MSSSNAVKNKYKHTCPNCGTRFITNSRHERFCSSYCASQYKVSTYRKHAQENNEELYKICREIDTYNKEHGN